MLQKITRHTFIPTLVHKHNDFKILINVLCVFTKSSNSIVIFNQQNEREHSSISKHKKSSKLNLSHGEFPVTQHSCSFTESLKPVYRGGSKDIRISQYSPLGSRSHLCSNLFTNLPLLELQGAGMGSL